MNVIITGAVVVDPSCLFAFYAPWKKNYDQPRQHIKKQGHYFVNKGPSSQSYGFSSSGNSYIHIYECENWTTKKTECRRINAFKLQC